MVRTVGRRLGAGATTLLVIASACNDPQSPKSPQPLAQLSLPGGATLAVDVATGGSDPDPDGYTVWVDGSLSQAVGTTGLVTFSGLAAGNHAVALYGLISNCGLSTLSGGSNNPRGVSLTEGVSGTTSFWVGCGSWGGLLVSTNTTGVDLDADGYAITVDGEASKTTATNGSVTFTLLNAGSHSVAVSGVAGNCTLSGTNPRAVTVSAGRTAPLGLSLDCAQTGSGTGRLTVITSSTGSNIPSGGYTVIVDGTLSAPVAATDDSVTFSVPAGDNPVALSGVPWNCTVSGANPRTVAVPADGAGATTFSVTCGVPQASVAGKGQTGLGSPELHTAVLTFAFDVRADLTGRFTFTAWDDVHPNGQAATFTTDASTDPATYFTAYRSSSSVCHDPSRGVEFEGLARGDEGYVASFTVIVCDNGPEGSNSDFVSFYIPSEGNGRSGVVTSGDIVKK